jgi:hypothetical protein
LQQEWVSDREFLGGRLPQDQKGVGAWRTTFLQFYLGITWWTTTALGDFNFFLGGDHQTLKNNIYLRGAH